MGFGTIVERWEVALWMRRRRTHTGSRLSMQNLDGSQQQMLPQSCAPDRIIPWISDRRAMNASPDKCVRRKVYTPLFEHPALALLACHIVPDL